MSLQAIAPEQVPAYVRDVVQVLVQAGYEAVVVGGSVRDLLLGKEPSDWDVTTSALPETVQELFPYTIPTGVEHGTVTVVHSSGATVEVTTFRTEAVYADGRRPEEVKFVTDLKLDLGRRDFTVNAIALRLDPLELVDPFGGQQDLMDGVLRTVGQADDRFSEDGLRAVRAARFTATLGLTPVAGMEDAMLRAAPVTAKVAVERFSQELLKMLIKAPKPSVGLGMLQRSGAMKSFMPLLTEEGFASSFHDYVDLASGLEPRLAILLFGTVHECVEPTLRGLKLSSDLITEVASLVSAAHTFLFFGDGISDAQIRQAVRSVGLDNLSKLLSTLVVTGSDVERVKAAVADGFVASTKNLALDGTQLLNLGLKGPAIGKAQRSLLGFVDVSPSMNNVEALTVQLRILGYTTA